MDRNSDALKWKKWNEQLGNFLQITLREPSYKINDKLPFYLEEFCFFKKERVEDIINQIETRRY